MRALLIASLVTIVAGFAAPAAAASPEAAAAQALFDDGKRFMSQHRFAEACDKFAESERLDPGMGTHFHLADCNERLGKIATAWAMFVEVAAQAKEGGQTARAAAAQGRVDALGPRVPRLRIDPGAESATSSLAIARDGVVLGRAQWGVAVPVDPGVHTIDVRADDKGAWHSSVDLKAAANVVVTVPLLADAPAEPAAISPPTTPPLSRTATTAAEVPSGGARGNGQRAVGVVFGLAGLAGLGVGTYFGVTSLSDHNDAQPHCTAAGCDPTGVSLRNDARQRGMASSVAFGAGGAALVIGLVTFFTAPHSSSSAGLAIGPGTVTAYGSF
jgi:hypothetical protein